MIFFLLPGAGFAGPAEQAAEDFRPLEGYLVQPHGDQFLIDLDAGDGIVRGDLFSVLGLEEKIVHPVTQKVIGTLETVKGYLQVTRLMEGYSFARPLSGAEGFESGDSIRRYERVPAVFWDYTGDGKALANRLQSNLPHLDWLDFETAQQSRPDRPAEPLESIDGLYFILTEQRLEVRGPQFNVLHQYESGAVGEQSAIPAAAAPGTAAVPSPSPKAAPAPRTATKYSAVFEGTRTLHNFSEITLMADFIELDGRRLLARTDGSKLMVYQIGAELTELAQSDTPVPANILALQWWRPSLQQPPLLAVNVWYDNRVTAYLYRFENRDLTLALDNIGYILGAFDIDGDRRPETLLGQRFDRKSFYGQFVKQLHLKNDRLSEGNPSLNFPRRFTVLGSVVADLTGDGKPETAFVRNGVLWVYSGSRRLYETPKEMGGSLSYITYEVDPQMKDFQLNNAFLEIPPEAVDLDRDGQPELVTVASDRPFVVAPGLGLRAGKMQLNVIDFRDGRFVKGTLGEMLDLAIQGVAVAGDEVLFIGSEPGSLLRKGNSHLLAYALASP